MTRFFFRTIFLMEEGLLGGDGCLTACHESIVYSTYMHVLTGARAHPQPLFKRILHSLYQRWALN